MNVVKSRTPGKLRLLLIDLTQDARGFEYETSRLIASEIKKRGVALASDEPLQLNAIEKYSEALRERGADFTALLIFAHGCPDQKDNTASKVLGG